MLHSAESVPLTIRSLRAAIWPAFFILLLGTRPAPAAEPLHFHLEYSVAKGAKGCPDEAAFVREVEALIASPFDAEATRHIAAHVEATSSGLRGVVRFEGLDATQSFVETPAHCRELASSMALALALAVERLQSDATRASGEGPKSEPKPPSTTSPAKPTSPRPAGTAKPATSPVVVPPRSTKSTLELATTAGVGLAAGYVPGIQPSASVGLRLGRQTGKTSRSIELGGLFVYPGDAHGSLEGRVLVALRAATLQPCLGVLPIVDACAAVTAGAHHARGSGVLNPQGQEVFFLALGARAVARAHVVRGIDLRLRGGADVALTRTAFSLGEEAVYFTPRLAGLLEVGLVAYMP